MERSTGRETAKAYFAPHEGPGLHGEGRLARQPSECIGGHRRPSRREPRAISLTPGLPSGWGDQPRRRSWNLVRCQPALFTAFVAADLRAACACFGACFGVTLVTGTRTVPTRRSTNCRWVLSTFSV